MPEDFDNRKYIAKVLRSVLVGKISVRQALVLYPKDTSDESLLAAYHALIHYEADEELRAKDVLYREEQDDYIEFLASILDKGENLPENIIQNYKIYHESTPILHENNPKGFFKGFWKNLNIGFRKDNK